MQASHTDVMRFSNFQPVLLKKKKAKFIKTCSFCPFLLKHLFIEMILLITFPLIEYQVLQLQLNAERLVDHAVQLTTGNQSQLNKLLQSGDLSQAVQLAKAAIVAVDVDEKIPQNKLKEKRKGVSTR